MSTVLHPVGSQRPSTYWRRRLVAVAIVVLLVVAVTAGVKALTGALGPDGDAGASASGQTGDGNGGPAPAAGEPSPAASPAASAPATPAADEPPACTAEQVSVVPVSDATSYAVGSTARLGMRISNTGAAECAMDAGAAALELLVTSGEDRIWSSDDCQKAAKSVPTVVVPGEDGVLESNVEWPLARSAEGCTAGLPELKPGTYQLVARAGEITSDPLVLTVT